MSRNAELPDDEHIEGRVQSLRDLGSDRNATARQAQHDRLFAKSRIGEQTPKHPPGVVAVLIRQANTHPGHFTR